MSRQAELVFVHARSPVRPLSAGRPGRLPAHVVATSATRARLASRNSGRRPAKSSTSSLSSAPRSWSAGCSLSRRPHPSCTS
eukprot:15481088-Alexandrium_andersonii.AAC.1